MECARRVFPVKDLPFSYSFRTDANAIWEESVRFGFCEQNREKLGSRGTGALGEQVLAASASATVRS